MIVLVRTLKENETVKEYYTGKSFSKVKGDAKQFKNWTSGNKTRNSLRTPAYDYDLVKK